MVLVLAERHGDRDAVPAPVAAIRVIPIGLHHSGGLPINHDTEERGCHVPRVRVRHAEGDRRRAGSRELRNYHVVKFWRLATIHHDQLPLHAGIAVSIGNYQRDGKIANTIILVYRNTCILVYRVLEYWCTGSWDRILAEIARSIDLANKSAAALSFDENSIIRPPRKTKYV